MSEEYRIRGSEAEHSITMLADITEVMRLTAKGIYVNEDLEVNDAAQKVLDAIDENIKTLVKDECEKLEQENKRLREALENILKHHELIAGKFGQMNTASKIAKGALKDSK